MFTTSLRAVRRDARQLRLRRRVDRDVVLDQDVGGIRDRDRPQPSAVAQHVPAQVFRVPRGPDVGQLDGTVFRGIGKRLRSIGDQTHRHSGVPYGA